MGVLRNQRLGVVAIHMSLLSNGLNYLVGKVGMELNPRPLRPYDPLVCDFLSQLSVALFADSQARRYPDVMSFAFWCRKANLATLKDNFSSEHLRLGVGYAFHIAPSNVPINFAFSYAFSLLAGNCNVVRVSSKDFAQTEIVCRLITGLLEKPLYGRITEMTAFVRYGHDDEITGHFSSGCNARIIWGGDATISSIRRVPAPPRSVEIAFADRYSFCIVSTTAILNANESELNKLAKAFYNDVYLMDQDACSSPHLIVWMGDADLKAAQHKFWHRVYEEVVSNYDLQPVNAIDKYTMICEKAIELDCVVGLERNGNFIYRLQMNGLPDKVDICRGRYGLFYELKVTNLNVMARLVGTKFQTLTYFGFDKAFFCDFVVQNNLLGIDRIVPIGSALDIGVIWDGYDIVSTLSRVIDIQ